MNPHQIRLAGPWEWCLVPSGGEIAVQAAVTRCQLPFTREFHSDSNAVSLHRGFHRPTGIDDGTMTLAVLDFGGDASSIGRDIFAASITVRLNGQKLLVMKTESLPDAASVSPSKKVRMAFDTSRFLKPFNDLHVVLRCDSTSPISLVAACLEIHDGG